jgi:hypothetical protein
LTWGDPKINGTPAVLVTAYRPTPERWSTDFRKRKTIMRKSKEFVHEGKYAAEVAVTLIEDDTAWSPYLSPDDTRKLDTVKLALRRGDIAEATKHGRVFELTPVAAK